MLACDGNQHINTDGNPDLSLDSVFGVAVEAFDVEVLFDPFEEEFHSPSGTIELGDGERGQIKVVGEEDEFALLFDIVEANAAEGFWVEARGRGAGQSDGGITSQSGGSVNRSVLSSSEVEVGFGPGDEEGFGCLEAVESFEVDVSSIHDIIGARFERELIEDGHIVRFALGNADKTRDAATKIKEGVQLDSGFSLPKVSPGEEGKAEINGGGIESVDGLVQGETEGLVDVE